MKEINQFEIENISCVDVEMQESVYIGTKDGKVYLNDQELI